MLGLELNGIEGIWGVFWRTSGNSMELEEQLPRSQMLALCMDEAVQNFIRHMDHQFYQNIVDVLIPDVLRPVPSKLKTLHYYDPGTSHPSLKIK